MNLQILQQAADEFVKTAPGNRVPAEIAITPELAELQLFEPPLLAVGAADDPLFETLRQPDIIGAHFKPPAAWLDGAVSVLSYFLPFTEAVRASNRANPSWPSDAWLHGRIEGQAFVEELGLHLTALLNDAGFPAVLPLADSRLVVAPKDGLETADGLRFFTSNWSERHVGYVCGIGTFSLSKGLITEKGMAGRMGSVVTALPLQPTPRRYRDYMDYCIECGVCALRCPAGAISPGTGKDHAKCKQFLDAVLAQHHPRYGCGKCQVDVPCETCIP